MKVQYSGQSINSFSGINFVFGSLRHYGIPQLVDKQLGARNVRAKFSYSDLIGNLWAVFFCGGDCAEDINEHLRPALSKVPGLKVANADTVLGALKQLATPVETYTSKQGVAHQFNIATGLNVLNVKLLKQLNVLQSGHSYDFDYDNQIIATEKYDAARTYKQVNGYQPGIASIGEHIVYLENRNGNSQAKYLQEETLERAYENLLQEGITINRSRMDCASYQKKVVEVVEKYSRLFYIRAMRSEDMLEKIKAVDQWETVKIGHQQYQVSSMEFTPFKGERAYRLVVQREKIKDGQADLFTGEFKYRSILTNDHTSTDQQVIEYYNQRGAQEIIHDEMNNDFGWKNLPFSFMNENTVFMLAMAMCRAIYKALIKSYSKKLPFLKDNFRLKKFIFRFISVSGKWIKRGRQDILKLFTDKPYHRLIT